MQGSALLLFVVFALVLVGMYISIRRAWFPPGVTAAVGVVVSMIVMVLISLAQNNPAAPSSRRRGDRRGHIQWGYISRRVVLSFARTSDPLC